MRLPYLNECVFILAIALLSLVIAHLFNFKRESIPKIRLRLSIILVVFSAALLYKHGIQHIITCYSSENYMQKAAYHRMFGAYGWSFWLVFVIYLLPLFLLIPKLRKSHIYMSITCLLIMFYYYMDRVAIYLISR